MLNPSQGKKVLLRNDEELIAPAKYETITEKEKMVILNGCGPDGPLEKLIPDNLLGLKITESCNIHDWMFHNAKNQEDYKQADETFLENLETQIERRSKGFIALVRKSMAYLYFLAVRAYSSLKGPTNK